MQTFTAAPRLHRCLRPMLRSGRRPLNAGCGLRSCALCLPRMRATPVSPAPISGAGGACVGIPAGLKCGDPRKPVCGCGFRGAVLALPNFATTGARAQNSRRCGGKDDAMTKPPFVAVALLTAAASFALGQPAAAQGDAEAQLGKVHFETSCNAAAQQ